MFFSGMRPLRFRAFVTRSYCRDRSLLLRIGLLRTVIATCLGLGMAVVLLGDEHDTKDPLPWEKAFQVVSASNKKERLVIVLITNEDPFLAAEAETNDEAKGNDEELGAGSQHRSSAWCVDSLEEAFRETLASRPDLRGRISMQSVVAGIPEVLTDGKNVNSPARAVLVVCDSKYRLLSLMVGVPDGAALLTLVEDGEEVATALRLQSDQGVDATAAIQERSRGRLSRLWRSGFDNALAAKEDNGGEQERTLGTQSQRLGYAFDPVYLADVRLRFGLSEKIDENRLVILEQHPETRRPWCQSLTPFVFGADFEATWRDLVEMIWGAPAFTANADVDDLLSWFDSQIETKSLVLNISPSRSQPQSVWPPVKVARGRRGVGWQEVHELATEYPFRVVDAQQLATLIHARDLKTVDLFEPTFARYIFVDRRKKLPLEVREGDPPGRFAGLLKRSKSKSQEK